VRSGGEEQSKGDGWSGACDGGRDVSALPPIVAKGLGEPTHAWQGVLFLCVSFAIACASGCATARNYTDPAGPIVTGQAVSTRRAANELRVVTFNLAFARHIDRAADLFAQPGPLMPADVLVLQEMDAAGTESLARALGMNFVYVPSAVHPSSHRDFGVAILSPWPLQDARKILLPHRHRFRGMRRSAAAATVGTPSGPVRVYSVHLETAFGASGRTRSDQARVIAHDAASWAGPVVVAGDFNGTDAAREFATLGYTWLTREVHNTAGLFDLDHIVVRGLCATGNPPAAKAPDRTNASDHEPVWASLRPCPPILRGGCVTTRRRSEPGGA
jgi:endonuclease/exonuclease/phosphatase family metal-dependent hydrolase